MNHHDQFLRYLNSRPDKEELLRVARAYKTSEANYAFELNGRLKGGLTYDKFLADLPHLKLLICATLARPITLFRMTSEIDFSGPVLQAHAKKLCYQAFMSTSDSPLRLGSFVQRSGRSLLLKIECPPGIAFAPLDLFQGTAEGEYLLGCGTTFELTADPEVLDATQANDCVPFSNLSELVVLKLKASSNPPYVQTANLITLI